VPDQRPDAVVVGAGIAGLVAAHDLAAAGRSELVLEGSPLVGGKLRLATVAGVDIDVGAESMLARRPEAVALAAELGIDLVHPVSGSAQLWTRGALRPLPRTLLGVPLELDALEASGVLSDEGLARARHETARPLDEADVSVADLIGSRLGPEVVGRLAEPRRGGV
jgi:oxygen-dependent protoporphyrinogen oxidase